MGGYDMKAIILATGQEIRLKNYTEKLPKGMLEFIRKIIVERQIELFKDCGIDDIIIVKDYVSEKIKGDEVEYHINDGYDTINIMRTLLKSEKPFDTDVLICHADILFNKEFLNIMIQEKGDYVVAVDDNWKNYWKRKYGNCKLGVNNLNTDLNGNVTSAVREGSKSEELDVRYIGLLRISNDRFKDIIEIVDKDEIASDKLLISEENINKEYISELAQYIIELGDQVKEKKFYNGWIEFDTNGDYELACQWQNTELITEFIDAI